MNFEPERPLDIFPAAFSWATERVFAIAHWCEEEGEACPVSRLVLLSAFSAPSLARPPPRGAKTRRAIPIAIADFDYTDTSGEPIDQQAEHQARLQAFVGAIRAALEQDGRYRVVTLACRQPPCTAANLPPAELLARASAAGAKRLLYGGIHKMSTLVQNAKVQMVDIENDKLTFDRPDHVSRRHRRVLAARGAVHHSRPDGGCAAQIAPQLDRRLDIQSACCNPAEKRRDKAGLRPAISGWKTRVNP